MRTRALLLLLAMLPALSGCALLDLFRSDTTLDEEARLQKSLERYGRSGTILLMKNIEEDKAKRTVKAGAFRKILEENVIPWLNNDDTQVTEAVWKGIIGRFEKLDASYQAVAQDAFDYLFEYVKVPTGDEILGPLMAKRALAFFTGAVKGCTIIESEAPPEGISRGKHPHRGRRAIGSETPAGVSRSLWFPDLYRFQRNGSHQGTKYLPFWSHHFGRAYARSRWRGPSQTPAGYQS